jgi:hypothetical protein
MVAGIACGGTSCVAGILHNAGIDMGQTAEVDGAAYYDGWIAYPENPKAQYEDDAAVKISWRILGGAWYYPKVPATLSKELALDLDNYIQARSREPLWGIKAPSFAFTGSFFLRAMKDHANPRLAVVYRDEYVTAGHIAKRFAVDGIRPLGAYVHVGEASRALWRLTAVATGLGIPCCGVHYEDLVADREEMVPRFLETLLVGWPKRTPEQVQKAIDFVDPSLNHTAGR